MGVWIRSLLACLVHLFAQQILINVYADMLRKHCVNRKGELELKNMNEEMYLDIYFICIRIERNGKVLIATSLSILLNVKTAGSVKLDYTNMNGGWVVSCWPITKGA